MSTRVYGAAAVASHPNGTPPMLVIRRTDTGALRMSDGRRTDTAATEDQARRVVTAWGYGNFSFNKALILMKESEGSIAPVANPWTARRGADPAASASTASVAPAVEPKSEPAPSTLKEPPTMNVPARSRRPRAAGAPVPEEATPASASPVLMADAPVAETATRPRRARKASAAEAEPAPAAAVGEAAPEPLAETPVVEPAEQPVEAVGGTRPRRARKTATPSAEASAEAQQPAEPAVQALAEEPVAQTAPRLKHSRNGAVAEVEAAPVAAEPSAAAETEAAPDQDTAPARKRGRRPKAETSGAADVQPAAQAEAVPAPLPEASSDAPAPAPAEPGADVASARPKRARAARRTAAEAVSADAPAEPAGEAPAPTPSDPPAPALAEVPAPAPKAERARARTAARTPEEWLEAARVLFAEGTQALRELESATLPFARGPWTELRTQSAQILACLQGRTPDRG